MATDTAAGGNRANKKKKALDLTQLTKEDLVDRIKQLEFHVNQLKNVIAKGNESTSKPKPSLRPFDFSLYSRRHVAMKVAYLGWDYRGFVVQEDTSKTIEHELFEALIRTRLIESRETSNYHRCGRTDKGVSAFCQVISIDLRSNMLEGLGIVPSQKENTKSNPAKGELDYVNMLNRTLPPEIRVLCWAPTRCDFSARFDCERRVYKYFFPRGDLDIEKMNVAAQKLVGTHDFRNLCKMDVGNGVVEFTRTVDSASVNGPGGAFSMCTFTVISKAFLWHQIRCIMAVLYLVGKSLEEPDIIDQLFDVVNHPCKPQYTMASELPLNLYDCVYTDVTWKYDQGQCSVK